MQISFADNREVRVALRHHQDRIRAVAIIHQMLESNTPALSSINMATYFDQLKRSAMQTQRIDPNHVQIRLDCDGVFLATTQALSVGLICSEFLGQILSEAYTHQSIGNLVLSLKMSESFVEFRIEDDGLEFPDTLRQLDGENLTMEMIRTWPNNFMENSPWWILPGPACRCDFRSLRHNPGRMHEGGQNSDS